MSFSSILTYGPYNMLPYITNNSLCMVKCSVHVPFFSHINAMHLRKMEGGGGGGAAATN